MKKNAKQEVMMVANEIRRATSKNRSVCLAKAWQLWRLGNQLRTGTVRFAYEKTDGTLRKATGTLQGVEHLVAGTGRPNYKTLSYYDLRAGAFRSFRVENLITIY